LLKRRRGEYKVIHTAEKFTIKTLTILPGKSALLKTHRRRVQRRIAVQGKIAAALNEKIYKLAENDYIYIKKGNWHKLFNKEKRTAILTEIRQGNILDENDIKRLD
jgi:mannose-6-phosphate isomerase-like protein (cupin superfamily)